MGNGAPTYLNFAQIQDAAVISGMNSVINASLTFVWPIVQALAVVYLVILFLQVANNAMTMNSFIGKMVRLLVVVALIHQSGIYTRYVRDLAFTEAPNAIAQVVTGTRPGVSAAAQFDTITMATDNLFASAMKQNTGWSVSGIGNAIALWVADGAADLMIAIMFGIWLLGRKLLAIVLCFGPWLLVLELFDMTRGFTSQWIGKIVGLLVFQLASATLMVIMLKGESTILQAIKASPGADIDQTIGTLMHLIAFLATDALTMIALPTICAIGSGVAAGHAVASGAIGGFLARSAGGARASAGRIMGNRAAEQREAAREARTDAKYAAREAARKTERSSSSST